MDIPDPVCDTEIAEMKALYNYGPERACLDRMIWLEVEHARMTDEIDYYQSEGALTLEAQAVKRAEIQRLADIEQALKELASMARTTEQLDLVHQLKCRGLLK